MWLLSRNKRLTSIPWNNKANLFIICKTKREKVIGWSTFEFKFLNWLTKQNARWLVKFNFEFGAKNGTREVDWSLLFRFNFEIAANRTSFYTSPKWQRCILFSGVTLVTQGIERAFRLWHLSLQTFLNSFMFHCIRRRVNPILFDRTVELNSYFSK